MVLSFEKISKYFGDRCVLSEVSGSIQERDRIGMIGANGTGKSTLLNILCDALFFESGALNLSKKITIGYLRQNSGLESDSTIYQEMKKVFADLDEIRQELDRLETQMASSGIDAETARAVSERYAALSTDFEQRDGYRVDVRIKTVLNGMGFSDKKLDTVINTMSGGERTRLAMARLLLLQPQLLVLDEPTNHLDFETLTWLERFLRDFGGAVLAVSHDRYFLDRVTDKTWELEGQNLVIYPGNYTKYLQLKQEKVRRQQKEYEQQQKKIAAMQEYADRNITRASTSKSAKSRLRALERMDMVEKPVTFTEKMALSFSYDFEPHRETLAVRELPLVVGEGGEHQLLNSPLSFVLERGDRLAITGANGSGKTTLLRLLSHYPPVHASIRWGGNVKIGYFDQQFSTLHPQNTVFDEVHCRFPGWDSLRVRSALGAALFSGERVYQKVGALSGGEKARLTLMLLAQQHPNVMLLDEPTNHLDLSVREALESALLQYTGTLILVSHDRYFLSRIPNKILHLSDREAHWFPGGYSELDAYLKMRTEAKQEPQPSVRRQNGYRSREQRARDAQMRNELSRLEGQVRDCDLRIREIELALKDPAVYSDYEASSALCQELEEMRKAQEAATEQWLLLSENAGS